MGSTLTRITSSGIKTGVSQYKQDLMTSERGMWVLVMRFYLVALGAEVSAQESCVWSRSLCICVYGAEVLGKCVCAERKSLWKQLFCMERKSLSGLNSGNRTFLFLSSLFICRIFQGVSSQNSCQCCHRSNAVHLIRQVI